MSGEGKPLRFRVRVREETRLRDVEAANKRIKQGKTQRERENVTERVVRHSITQNKSNVKALRIFHTLDGWFCVCP